MMTENTDNIRYHLKLHLAEGVGAITFARLIEHFGSAEAAATAPTAALKEVEGVGDKTAAAVAAVSEDQVQGELELAQRLGVRILTYGSPEYPLSLRNIHDPPAVLYLRGSLEKTDTVALAVVGSRRCTHYGMEQAGRFGGLFGRAGFTVISGGARGIDAAAHRGAIEAGGRTIAVMGCGLAHLYPPENRPLFEQIVSDGHGAILSELPMGVEVQARNFPRRNRIISGLSQGVLIIEAAYRSGSLITAHLAGEQGRPVFAVPGRVDSPFSQGTNQLIRDGATLVQNLDDVLEQLDALGEAIERETPQEVRMETPPPPRAELDTTESRIVAVFDGDPLSIDRLAAATGLAAHQVVAAMTTLTLKGVVASRPGSLFELRRRST
jgi:DNA processing protein